MTSLSPEAPTSPPSITFGTPESLTQIKTLTDITAMTRHLHECISFQHHIDQNLETILSNIPNLDKHLQNLQSQTNLLDLVKLESEEDGRGGVVYAICELQDKCDSRGSLVLKKYVEYRKLSKLTSEINAYKNDVMNEEDVEGPDPREIELFLEEILSLTHLGEDYTEYMVFKIKGLS